METPNKVGTQSGRAQVIYAWNYKAWGGVQIYFLSLIKEVRKQYDVIVLIPKDSDPLIIDALRRLEIRLEFLPPAPDTQVKRRLVDRILVRYRNMSTENRMVDRILELCDGRESIVQPDLGFWQSTIPIFRLARKTNLVITHHTPLKKQWWLRDLIWKIKGHFVASLPRMWMMAENDDGRKSLAPYLGEKKSSEVLLTYAGFDEDEISGIVSRFAGIDVIRQRYDLPHTLLIATLGQFIERKGCWTVLDALRKLSDDGVDFTFIWLSTSAVTDEIQQKVDKFGLGRRFRILPAKEMEDMRTEPLSLLLAADVFVLASLEEGLPIALIEAMALGKAILSTDVNAIPEAIENGVSGVLIRPNDPGKLAEEMKRLLLDPDRRRTLGTNARKTADERFNEKTTAALTLGLYDRILQTDQVFQEGKFRRG